MKHILFSDNHRWAQFHFRGPIMKCLLESGYRVSAVAPESGYVGDDNTISGVHVFSVSLNRTGTGFFNLIKYFFQLYKIYRKEKPDVIIHYTILPILVGSTASWFSGRGIRMAFLAGISEIIRKRSLKGALVRFIMKLCFVINKYVIVLNRADYDFILNNNLVKNGKLILFENGEGINPENYIPETIKKAHGFSFVMMSRLLWSKGYKEFIEAAKVIKREFPDTSFILCGELDEHHPDAVPEEQLRQDVNAKTVVYKGRILNVQEEINSSDCFVLPSYYTEGMNRSLMEALALGKPVITSATPGCAEMVENGKNGFVCKPKCVESLITEMRKMLSLSESERLRMGQFSQEICQTRFHIRFVAEKYLDIIEK